MHLKWMNDQLLQFPTVQVELQVDQRMHTSVSTPQRFIAAKTRAMVEALLEQLGPRWPRHILELGIHQGGSAVLYCELFKPQRLLAVDIAPQAPAVLEAYRQAHPELCLALGTDQADGPALERACAQAFGAAAPQLVIDDASHFLGLTQASFTQLFPRLAPGGLYVIEDWAWAHWPAGSWQHGHAHLFEGRLPLSNLVLKLMLMAASRPDAVLSVRVTLDQVFVERGSGALAPGFDLEACLLNRGQGLPTIGKGQP